jgi:hypothetical protein
MLLRVIDDDVVICGRIDGWLLVRLNQFVLFSTAAPEARVKKGDLVPRGFYSAHRNRATPYSARLYDDCCSAIREAVD